MLRRNPLIYEINTWVWLNELSAQEGERITLANVPQAVIDALVAWRVDVIWMMGVWTRSAAGRQVALTHPDLQAEYRHALPDFGEEDVVGSPYAVRRYAVDPALGGAQGLAAFRAQLAQHGLKLFLDYVPNHVAIDHHWTDDGPGALVQGTLSDLERDPGTYFSVENGRVFGHGRDPSYPAWSDTAQVDAFSEDARQQSRATLLDIATQCDGVRCDMAMLLVNRIFARTWKRSIEPPQEFWSAVIPAVRAAYPEFTFMGEVYWNMEAEMLSLGFDYTYDKRLYDRMRDGDAGAIRDHIAAGLGYQQHMVRFTENHDEARALTAFQTVEKACAANALTVLLPGASLLYEGQFEGRRVKLPVQLGRRRVEPIEPRVLEFARKLLAEATADIYHTGTYLALAIAPRHEHDATNNFLLAFVWTHAADWRIVALNYSEQPAQGRIMLPNPAWNGAQARTFLDILTGDAVQVPGDDLLTGGLAIELAPYQVRIYHIE